MDKQFANRFSRKLFGFLSRTALMSAVLTMALPLSSAFAEGASVGNFRTIQDEIEGLAGPAEVNIEETMSVFSFVFGSLADSVFVYPTEDYFYFSFNKDGVGVSGNLRLDLDTRDKGTFHFAYFSSHSNISKEQFFGYKLLGNADGIVLTKVAPFEYDMTFEGKTVRFSLNDLRDVKPPETMIQKDETYIGPVFDESGLQFYLIYNQVQKLFLYVLNESEPLNEIFTPSEVYPELVVGYRTDFVLHLDPLLDRFLLVGVNNENTEKNNYFDGPFDQLPDNFVEGEALREALIDWEPEYKGTIDRLGGFNNGESRVVIAPYIQYSILEDLAPISKCLDKVSEAEPQTAYLCFDQRNLEPVSE